MNTLFCTVAKHLFGIKMCTSVPVFLLPSQIPQLT